MIVVPAVAFALASVAYAAVTPAKRTLCPDGVTSVLNTQCCKFVQVKQDLLNDVFENVCGENAHSAVRIAFHDAIGFSIHGGKGNGADGSIIAFESIEVDTFAANAGIDDIADIFGPFATQHNISFGDVIHFGSSVALSLCPGAPVVQTFVGRGNATQHAPDGTVPDPFDTTTNIIARFADAGFNSDEIVALLASHSIAAQDKVDETIHGSPFDSTPGSFDPQFFLETQLRGTLDPGNDGTQHGEVNSPLPGEFRLQSDHLFARDARTSCTWQSFVTNQRLMASKFAAAMAKLSLLGQSRASLTDCTELITPGPPTAHQQAFFPAGKTHADIEQACATAAFPSTLSTQAGHSTSVAPVPTQ